MTLQGTIGNVFDALSANVPRPEKEYIGQDGLLHCAVCHKAVQVRTEVPELGIKKTVRCICDCKVKEFEAEERRKKQEDYDRQRRICFAETNMAAWTFENDDRQNPKISNAMQKYAVQFETFKQNSKGLLLYGSVGTGKTYYAACIANRLIDNGYTCLMTNFARLTNQIQGMYEGKQEFLDSLNSYSLLVIDDLGAERKTDFMQEMVFNIIDSRYRSGLPFIITTNLTMDEIKKPQEVGYARIYDRVLQHCFPVEVSGVSRRRQSVRQTYNETKQLLGL